MTFAELKLFVSAVRRHCDRKHTNGTLYVGDGRLVFVANGREIEYRVDCPTVADVLEWRLFAEAVDAIKEPTTANVLFDLGGGAFVVGGKTRYALAAPTPQERSEWKHYEEHGIDLPVDAIKTADPYRDKEAGRFALNYFALESGRLIATDGLRMFVSAQHGEQAPGSILFPSPVRFIGKESTARVSPAESNGNETGAIITVGKWTIREVVAGRFPKWQECFPPNSGIKGEFVCDMTAASKAIAALPAIDENSENEKTVFVMTRPAARELIVRRQTHERQGPRTGVDSNGNQTFAVIPAETDDIRMPFVCDEEMTLALNRDLLAEVVKGGFTTVRFNGEKRATLFTRDDGAQAIIMPISSKSDPTAHERRRITDIAYREKVAATPPLAKRTRKAKAAVQVIETGPSVAEVFRMAEAREKASPTVPPAVEIETPAPSEPKEKSVPYLDDAIRATAKANDYESHVKAAKLWGMVAAYYEDADDWRAASMAIDAQQSEHEMATECYQAMEKTLVKAAAPANVKRTRKARAVPPAVETAKPKASTDWRALLGGSVAMAF